MIAIDRCDVRRILSEMSWFARSLCLPIVSVVVLAGCGGRCRDVASARAALASRRGAPDRGADLRVTLPFAQVDRVFAELLAARPVTVPLAVPDLGLGALGLGALDALHPTGALTATATRIELRPGPGMAIRFATVIAVREDNRDLTTLAAEIDVTPIVHRGEVVIGFGPRDVVSVKPVLGDGAKAVLGDAIARHLPDRLRVTIPRRLLDAAAGRLAGHLTGEGFEALRRTLFARLGELATWRVNLPDVPIARHVLRSSPTALVIEVVTDLPVRRGLDAAVARDVATVEISGSAAAELANWALVRGYLPRWYDRGLTPRSDGEFTPRFDFVAGDAHPLKIHVLQDRGGCSYFRVGIAATIELAGDRLIATATDRDLEAATANPLLEVAATAKYFLFGWIDESKQVAAHMVLRVGASDEAITLATRVTAATLERGELRFGLTFEIPR